MQLFFTDFENVNLGNFSVLGLPGSSQEAWRLLLGAPSRPGGLEAAEPWLEGLRRAWRRPVDALLHIFQWKNTDS